VRWRQRGEYQAGEIMTFDSSKWEKERNWLKKKAREVRNLSSDDLAFIDSRISAHLKDDLRHWATHRWWRLFGSQGHSLKTLDDEARFIESLDRAFEFPAPSSLIAAPSHARQDYTVREVTRRGIGQKVSFSGPPVGRLLELMLYGFFDFDGRWIFINRSGQFPSGDKSPDQWHVLADDLHPSDRLGVRVTVNTGWRGRHHPPPNAAFSSLPTASKECAAADHGSQGTHQEWMEGLADSLCERTYLSGPPTFLELAGDYALDSYPLADLIASGKRISGMRTEPVNGNYFDCRPENLVSRSSRGRKMKCNSCRKPTTAKESNQVKDSTGSTFRICLACQAWAGRLSP
jgi:hypothetical protein